MASAAGAFDPVAATEAYIAKIPAESLSRTAAYDDGNHWLHLIEFLVSTAILWIVFALLLYMRYGAHLNGRRLAQLTIVAFVLLLFTLASSHTFERGITP